MAGETIAADGRPWGSYQLEDDNLLLLMSAIMLVSAYIVERGLILDPYEVESKRLFEK